MKRTIKIGSITYWSVFLLIVLGNLWISVLIHEGVHLIQGNPPTKICYNLTTDHPLSGAVMNVDGTFDNEGKWGRWKYIGDVRLELPAYFLQLIYLLVTNIIIIRWNIKNG